MPRPLRVFLCHASQDKPAVRELYNALKTENWIDPWLDKAKILPGQDWEMVIEKAVDDSDVVIICLSNQAVTREGFVQREIRYAYDIALEKPEETIFLIPLRLEDCNVPRKLKQFHWVDYFGSDKQDAFSDLLEALKIRHDQKIKAEEAEHRNQAQKEADELSRQLAVERTVREKADQEARIKNEGKQNYTSAHYQEQRKPKTQKVKPERKIVQSTTTKSMGRMDYPTYISIGTMILFVLGVIYVVRFFINTSIPSEKSAPDNGSTAMSEKDGMTMLYVPAGRFEMGSADGPSDELPHVIELSAFWVDQTEVTNSMYAKCVSEGACDQPTDVASATHSIYYNNLEFQNHPVVHVDWYMAKAYCEWAGGRLPTEAEWEKAARGTDARIYPWGNELPNDGLLNYNKNVGDTTEVGKYPGGKSFYGAYDMAGNVWEWVDDWYDSEYYQSSPLLNPLGPDAGQNRAQRGGAWDSDGSIVRSSSRGSNGPDVAYDNAGFRCVRSP